MATLTHGNCKRTGVATEKAVDGVSSRVRLVLRVRSTLVPWTGSVFSIFPRVLQQLHITFNLKSRQFFSNRSALTFYLHFTICKFVTWPLNLIEETNFIGLKILKLT
jgi:hypothetical protein